MGLTDDLKRCMMCWQLSGWAKDGGLMPWDEYCEHLKLGGMRRPKKAKEVREELEDEDPQGRLI